MGKVGGHLPHPLKCCQVFCALVVTLKRSVDQLFMHYFHNFSSASEDFGPRPHWDSAPEPCWQTFVFRPPNLPTPGRNPACAHGVRCRLKLAVRDGVERVDCVSVCV